MQVAGTEPYPWPYDGELAGQRLALLAVAAQRWFADRTVGGALALAVIEEVARAVRASGGLVVHVRLGGRARRPPLPERGSASWALLVETTPTDEVVDACGLDGFYGSPLDALLRGAGADRLLIGGLGLEGPVHSTLRSANDQGYECLLVADACAAHEPDLVPNAIDTVLMSGGIFGAVGTATAIVEALGSTRGAPVPANLATKEPT